MGYLREIVPIDTPIEFLVYLKGSFFEKREAPAGKKNITRKENGRGGVSRNIDRKKASRHHGERESYYEEKKLRAPKKKGSSSHGTRYGILRGDKKVVARKMLVSRKIKILEESAKKA